jgi:hypothetical protein
MAFSGCLRATMLGHGEEGELKVVMLGLIVLVVSANNKWGEIPAILSNPRCFL